MSRRMTSQQALRCIPAIQGLCLFYRQPGSASEMIEKPVRIHPVKISSHPLLCPEASAVRQKANPRIPKIIQKYTRQFLTLLCYTVRFEFRTLTSQISSLFYYHLNLIVF